MIFWAILIPPLDPRQAQPTSCAVTREAEAGTLAAARRSVHESKALEDGMAAQRGLSPVLAFVLGAVVVALIVAGYFYYQRTHRDVVKIDVPGFQGEISKDKGIDIEVGKQ
jgi:hypothetical protein